jgi:hypothetical protein
VASVVSCSAYFPTLKMAATCDFQRTTWRSPQKCVVGPVSLQTRRTRSACVCDVPCHNWERAICLSFVRTECGAYISCSATGMVYRQAGPLYCLIRKCNKMNPWRCKIFWHP